MSEKTGGNSLYLDGTCNLSASYEHSGYTSISETLKGCFSKAGGVYPRERRELPFFIFSQSEGKERRRSRRGKIKLLS